MAAATGRAKKISKSSAHEVSIITDRITKKGDRTIEAIELSSTEGKGHPMSWGYYDDKRIAKLDIADIRTVDAAFPKIREPKKFTTRSLKLSFPGGDVFTAIEFIIRKRDLAWIPTDPLEVIPFEHVRTFDAHCEWSYPPGETILQSRGAALQEMANYNAAVLARWNDEDEEFPWRVVVEIGELTEDGYGSFQIGGNVGHVDLSFKRAIRLVHPTDADRRSFSANPDNC